MLLAIILRFLPSFFLGAAIVESYGANGVDIIPGAWHIGGARVNKQQQSEIRKVPHAVACSPGRDKTEKRGAFFRLGPSGET